MYPDEFAAKEAGVCCIDGRPSWRSCDDAPRRSDSEVTAIELLLIVYPDSMRRDASELWSLLYYVTLFWAFVYALFYAALRYRRHTIASDLPAPLSLGSRGITRNFFKSSSTQVTLHKLSLRVHSTAFSSTHDHLTEVLWNPARSRARNALTRFYDMGSLLGVVGMLSSLFLLIWTSMRMLNILTGQPLAKSADFTVAPGTTMHKRATEFSEMYAEHPAVAEKGNIPIQVIVSIFSLLIFR